MVITGVIRMYEVVGTHGDYFATLILENGGHEQQLWMSDQVFNLEIGRLRLDRELRLRVSDTQNTYGARQLLSIEDKL